MARTKAPQPGEVFRELGPRFFQERKRLKLSQEQIGARVGLGQEAISRLENGSRGVESARLIRMLQLLSEKGADVTFIVTGKSSPTIAIGEGQVLAAIQKLLRHPPSLPPPDENHNPTGQLPRPADKRRKT